MTNPAARRRGLLGGLMATPLATAVPARSAPEDGRRTASGPPPYLTPWRDDGGRWIIRITDAAAFGSAARVLRHAYARIQPWNADGSLLFLGFTHPGHLLDGRSLRHLRTLRQPADAVWSNTDPGTMYGVADDALVRLDVRDGRMREVRRFPRHAALRLGSGEGNLSNDDRLVVLFGRNARDGIDVLCYDRTADAVSGLLPLPLPWSSVQSLAASASQSGRYVVVEYADRGTGALQGKKVYDPGLTLLRTLSPGTGHADLGIDARGDDVIVTADDAADRNDRGFDMIRLADGRRTRVLGGDTIGWQTHVSCRATARPGRCWIGTLYATPARDYDWAPFYDHGIEVTLDGSQTVERVVRLRHGANTDYERQPHLVPDREGARVLWASDWLDARPAAPVHAYVASLTPPR